MYKVIALIPARGGSKGVPGKNIRSINGTPLIVRTIKHARECDLISEVYVSTDSEDIAEVASRAGALVPFRRPKNISGDFSTDWECFKHFLDWWATHKNEKIDALAHMRCTTPIRDKSQLRQAILNFMPAVEYDSLRSISPSPLTPYKMWTITPRGLKPFVRLKIEGEDAYNLARQALPDVYIHDSFVDLIRPSTIIHQRSMSGRKIMPFLLGSRSIDIDNEDDFIYAQMVIEKNEGTFFKP